MHHLAIGKFVLYLNRTWQVIIKISGMNYDKNKSAVSLPWKLQKEYEVRSRPFFLISYWCLWKMSETPLVCIRLNTALRMNSMRILWIQSCTSSKKYFLPLSCWSFFIFILQFIATKQAQNILRLRRTYDDFPNILLIISRNKSHLHYWKS